MQRGATPMPSRALPWSRARTINAGMVAIAALTALALALATSGPIYDSALFEYVGRSIAGGATLYRDVWDNKLPSIFYVNALWTLLAGDRAVARAVIGACIDLGSVALFARLLWYDGIRMWGVASGTLGVLLAVLGYANDTEHYALPLILAGLLAARTGRKTLAGLAILGAASFWIPAVLTLAVTLTGPRSHGFRAVAAAAAGAIAAALLFVFAFGPGVTRELFTSWTAYVGGTESLATRFADARGVAVPMALIGALTAAGALSAWSVRTSANGQRALAWIAAGLAGAVLPLHPFVHYFLPLIPAALYGIAIGGRRLEGRSAAAAAAAGFALAMAFIVHGHRPGADSEAARVERVAAVLRAGLVRGEPIALDAYEPAMYLASGAPLRDRFELAYFANERFVAAARKSSVADMRAAYAGGADALVLMASAAPPHAGSFVEVCAQAAAPWHVFVRPPLATHFARCG